MDRGFATMTDVSAADIPDGCRGELTETMSAAELLALVLGGGAAAVTAAQLLAQAGTLPELARLDAGELARVPGMSRARAVRIRAAIELGKRSLQPRAARARVNGPADIAAMLMPCFQHASKEHFGTLLLSARNSVISRSTVSIGSLNASLVHPRELFRPAIIQRAARVVLFHNHPSGDPTPSPEDLTLTRRLESAGRTLGIPVVDHVILGDGTFHSMREGKWEGLTFA